MAPITSLDAEVPDYVEVPAANVGRVIGVNGCTIQRLMKSTGCQIAVPRGHTGDDMIAVQLSGGPVERRAAIDTINKLIAAGEDGDREDPLALAEGAMVVTHGLNSFDREAWCAWRLVPAERELGVTVDMGRNSIRLWAAKGRMLTPASAREARLAAEAAIAEARQLVEMTVDCRIELEPEEHVNYDAAVNELIDKHGILLHVPRPEEGVVPVKVVGPVHAAKDAATLIEARFVKGKSTASVLQVPGHIQGMGEQMAADFKRDVADLGTEFNVTVHYSTTLLWIVGDDAQAVDSAKQTLQEMMCFYMPKDYFMLGGLKPAVVKELRKDADMRVLLARDDCAVAFNVRGGTAWICGRARDLVQRRIDAVTERWNSENWEMELPDYGSAMWLLGPKGTGDYLLRMQAESGAKIEVHPAQLRVTVHGEPFKLKVAQGLIKEALQRLEEKKRQEEEAPLKPKKLLSAHPPHMQAILEQLAMLDEKKVVERKKERLREYERDAEIERQRIAELEGRAPPRPAAVLEHRSGQHRIDRSRSRDRDQPAAST